MIFYYTKSAYQLWECEHVQVLTLINKINEASNLQCNKKAHFGNDMDWLNLNALFEFEYLMTTWFSSANAARYTVKSNNQTETKIHVVRKLKQSKLMETSIF